MGMLPHLFSMWPHPQQRSHQPSGPAFFNPTRHYHTRPGLMPFSILLCMSPHRLKTKTSDDAPFYPFCPLTVLGRGLPTYHTCLGMAMPSFSGSSFSRILCGPSVLFQCTKRVALNGTLAFTRSRFL